MGYDHPSSLPFQRLGYEDLTEKKREKKKKKTDVTGAPSLNSCFGTNGMFTSVFPTSPSSGFCGFGGSNMVK